MKKLIMLLSLVISFMTYAQIKDEDQMIEIGAGQLSGETVEAIFRVNSQVTFGQTHENESVYFVLVRLKADGSIADGKFQYLDINARLLGVGFEFNQGDAVFTTLELTALNLNLKRNLALDLDRISSISLVALRFHTDMRITPKFRMMLEASMDFLGAGLTSKKASDSYTLSRAGAREAFRTQIEVAAEFMNKIRIAVGTESTQIQANGETFNTGRTICEDRYYTDPFSDEDDWNSTQVIRECYDEKQTNYKEFWQYNSTYVSLMAQITNRIRLFAKASYNVFRFEDKTGTSPNHKDANWLFMFGASLALNSRKP